MSAVDFIYGSNNKGKAKKVVDLINQEFDSSPQEKDLMFIKLLLVDDDFVVGADTYYSNYEGLNPKVYHNRLDCSEGTNINIKNLKKGKGSAGESFQSCSCCEDD